MSITITISAGTVAFKSNTLVVNSSQLTLDKVDGDRYDPLTYEEIDRLWWLLEE